MADRQVEFQITDEIVAAAEEYLSPERLAAYYFLARGNRKVGLLLYERNMELSEALYGVVQSLEIILRNAIHNIITQQFGHAEWYEKIGLAESEKDAITKAKHSIEEAGQLVTSGRIVAEVNFGFWVRLCSGYYDKTIWTPYIRRVFPIKVRRRALHTRLMDLKALRNRIAHHQRIIGGKRDLVQDYADILETISWLSPGMAVWVAATNCFLARAEKKLRKLAEPAKLEAAAVAIPDAPH
ncbi:MAG: Abi family protein [Candidatus Korobacteraceae bacterium]